jgi:sec-independent protein translocase protein TatC
MVLLVSVYFTIPFFFYQCWLFFQPGLYNKEVLKLKFIFLIILSNYCFITYFLYNPILFWSWSFFASFETSDIDTVNLYFEAKLNEYFNFLFYLYFYIGFLLQCVFTAFANLFFFIKDDIKKIVLIRKYFYIAIVTLAALITPPDIISQIIVAAPIIFCYELFIMILFFKKEYTT